MPACIVHAIAEFGIDADLGKPTTPVSAVPTLTLVRP